MLRAARCTQPREEHPLGDLGMEFMPHGKSGRRTRSPWTYWSTSRPRRAKASSQSRSTALSGPRQLIEQIANSLHKPGDEQVFVEADQLAREVENAMRNAP